MGFFDDLWDGIKQAPKFIINTGKDVLHEGTSLVGGVVNTAGGFAKQYCLIKLAVLLITDLTHWIKVFQVLLVYCLIPCCGLQV